jgi:hypothetical protein
MTNKISWLATLVLGSLFVFSAIKPPNSETKWYVRLLITALGIFLLYASFDHLNLLKSK